MAQVTVRVGGYSHPVACQDGQERHLTQMAAEVDRRIGALKAMGMQFGETRMLLLAALQLADETSDLHGEIAGLKAALAQGGNGAAQAAPAADAATAALAEENGALKAQLAALRQALEEARAAPEAASPPPSNDPAVASRLNDLAETVEAIATAMERA